MAQLIRSQQPSDKPIGRGIRPVTMALPESTTHGMVEDFSTALKFRGDTRRRKPRRSIDGNWGKECRFGIGNLGLDMGPFRCGGFGVAYQTRVPIPPLEVWQLCGPTIGSFAFGPPAICREPWCVCRTATAGIEIPPGHRPLKSPSSRWGKTTAARGQA